MADQTLAALTAATPATGGLFYGTQSGADRKFTLTAAGAAMCEADNAASQRTALGLNALATLTPGTGMATLLATPNLTNLNTTLGTSVAALASPTFTGVVTTPTLLTSGGQITSTVDATATTPSLDFYAHTGEDGWPQNGDKWFTWSVDVNGTKIEIMKLYAVDATAWYLSGRIGLRPQTIGPDVDDGLDYVTFYGGTLKFVQAGAPTTDIGKGNQDVLVIAPDSFKTRVGNTPDAQTFYVANTHTNNINGEWFVIDWETTSNVARVGTEMGSDGGTARDMQFVRGGTTKVTVGANTTDHAQPVKPPNFIVSGLPDATTCGLGALAVVTDATSTATYTNVTGGGSYKVLVMSDGTNWIIH